MQVFTVVTQKTVSYEDNTRNNHHISIILSNTSNSPCDCKKKVTP